MSHPEEMPPHHERDYRNWIKTFIILYSGFSLKSQAPLLIGRVPEVALDFSRDLLQCFGLTLGKCAMQVSIIFFHLLPKLIQLREKATLNPLP